MRIRNIEKWQDEVEQVMKDTFAFVDTRAKKIETPNGFILFNPIQIKKCEKPWVAINIDYEGNVAMWDSTDWTIYRIFDTTNYPNKMSFIADMVKVIMGKDKYCTMF